MAAVGGENAMSTLNGWFKELYASQEIKLVPEALWMVKNVKYNKAEAGLGNLYHQPVVLTQEHGVSYAGPSSGAFALGSPIAAVLKDATIEGSQLLIRSQIDYESAARAANSKGSFGDATGLLVENMLDSISKRLELMFLYGRSALGLGVLSGGSTTTLVISAATWSAGAWAGLEGARLSVVSALTAGTDRGTNTNATTTIEANALKVSSINFSTRTITVPTMPLAAAAGDIVFFYEAAKLVAGAVVFQESLGLDAIINLQVSDGKTLFNVDTTAYGLFKPNTPTLASGALTVTKILNMLLPAIGKGLMEDVVVLCSHTAWQNLVNPTVDPAAQAASANQKTGAIVTQNRQDKMTFGARGAEIIGAQGKVEIVPHLFVKDNDVFAFPRKALMRVGATDITFNTPGSKGGEFFLQLPSSAGYELRAYANQALFSPTPGKLSKGVIS